MNHARGGSANSISKALFVSRFLLATFLIGAAFAGISASNTAAQTPGSVWAWGENTYGQLGDGTAIQRSTPGQVVGAAGAGFLTDAVSVACGFYHSGAVKSDGTVWTWGDNSSHQLGDGTTVRSSVPVQVKGPGGVGFLAGMLTVGCGYDHSAAVKSDGTVWAWGFNGDGQLGDGTTMWKDTPVEVKGPGGSGFLTDVKAVACGFYYSVAVKNDGTVWAWGYNGGGFLGDGTTTNRTTPVQVKGPGGTGFLTGVVAVAGGYYNSLAVKSDGTVWAWGNNWAGQLGDGTTAIRATPVQVKGPGGTGFLADVVAVGCGGGFSVAVKRDGTVWAWGDNRYGQLGDGTTTVRTTPVQVQGPGGTGFLTGVVTVASSFNCTVALKSDGTVWAWGINNGSTPVQILGPGGTDFLSGVAVVACGLDHSAVVKNDGTVWAWGDNQAGQLGDGRNWQRTVPTQVLGLDGTGFLTNVSIVACGFYHSAAVKSDGTIWTWGDNVYGRLGDGTFTQQRTTPVQVKSPDGTGFLTGVVAAACGDTHSVAVKSDGTVWAWGNNDDWQLGDGTLMERATPVQVLGPGGTGFLTGVTAVACAGGFSLVLKSDGTVWGWGDNDDIGNLGDGTTTTRSTPVQVVGPGGTGFLTGVVAVACGEPASSSYFNSFSVALKSDGTVWAWGKNWYGQLGDGTTIWKNTPVQVKGPNGSGFLADVKAVACGGYHSIALKQDGTVWAWGGNGSGQLGDGTTTQRTTPVQVRGPGGTGFLTDVTAVACASGSSVAIKNDGTVWAWGRNSVGQLGINTADVNPHFWPVQVLGPEGTGFLTGAVAVAGGGDHTVAVVGPQPTYTVTFTVETFDICGGLGAGVSALPDGGTITWTPNQSTYHYGDVIRLQATPSMGYEFGGWFPYDGAAVLDEWGPQTAMFVTGNTEVRADFLGLPPLHAHIAPLTAGVDDWVYQNTATTLAAGGHQTSVTVVIENANGNTTYEVTLTKLAGDGTVTFPSNGVASSTLVKNIVGGDRPTDFTISGVGTCTFDVSLHGVQSGETVDLGSVTINVRQLGDVNNDGMVDGGDKSAINAYLNGVVPPTRNMDLNLDGDVDAGDKSVINAILNGVL